MPNSIDYYNSLYSANRGSEDCLINAAVCQGIVPNAVRYDLLSNEFSGILKSTSGDMYHFSFNTITNELVTNLVDHYAEHGAEQMFQKSSYGFDLKKADELDEESEDEAKAVGGGGGAGAQQGSAQPATVTEEQAVAQQNRLLTEQHPGAAVGITPDRPDRGRQWHQETVKNLQQLGEDIIKSVDAYFPKVSESEKQFLVEILGRAPDEVDSGDTHMTPIQKVTYQKWLNKSIYSDYRPLKGWLSRRA